MHDLQLNYRTLDTELERLGVLPHEGLYLGTATDELPVLFNILDTNAKHVLIKCASRFPFETMIRARSEYQQNKLKVEFLMISNEDMCDEVEWQKIISLSYRVKSGIKKQAIVVFIEELDNMLKKEELVLKYFRKLLLDSMDYPVRIITCSARQIPIAWEQLFHVIKETDYGTCLYRTDDCIFWTPV